MYILPFVPVRLPVGCRLLFNPWSNGDDWESIQFAEKYRGKVAMFVGYSEECVGLLDGEGRLPGRYVRPDRAILRFEDGREGSFNLMHFTLLDMAGVELVDPSETQRSGDLPWEIMFYPGDTVQFQEKPECFPTNTPRLVSFVELPRLPDDGQPLYVVFETKEERRLRPSRNAEQGSMLLPMTSPGVQLRATASQLSLVMRGPVWHLYHGSANLWFESEQKEMHFWAQPGITRNLTTQEKNQALGLQWPPYQYVHLSPDQARKLFDSGLADLIGEQNLSQGMEISYEARRLHDCFAIHRARVRALSGRNWKQAA